jgi:uncharacterized membrane protein YwaF
VREHVRILHFAQGFPEFFRVQVIVFAIEHFPAALFSVFARAVLNVFEMRQRLTQSNHIASFASYSRLAFR